MKLLVPPLYYIFLTRFNFDWITLFYRLKFYFCFCHVVDFEISYFSCNHKKLDISRRGVGVTTRKLAQNIYWNREKFSFLFQLQHEIISSNVEDKKKTVLLTNKAYK